MKTKKNINPSDRICSERIDIGLTQKQLAVALGVTEQSQVQYENGKLPKFEAYLEKFAQLGADISYIITGKRGGVILSEEEKEFLKLLRKASPEMRETACEILRSGTVITKQVHVGRDNFGNIKF